MLKPVSHEAILRTEERRVNGFFVIRQEPLHFNGGHASRARGGDRLAVVAVLDVTGVKDALQCWFAPRPFDRM